MSNPAKLTPNMMAELIRVRDYRTLTGIRSITQDALLRRNLVRWQSENVFVLTEAGREIVGRKDTAEFEATLAVEPTDTRCAGCASDAFSKGHRPECPESTQREAAKAPMPAVTDHTGWGVIADGTGTVRCVGVHTSRDESEACAARRRVRPAAAPCCSLRSRGIDCLCADAAADRLTGFEDFEFSTCEHGEAPDDCDACLKPVDNRSAGNRLVLDNVLIGLVLGTSIDPATGAANGVDVLIDGDVQSIPHMVLDLCDVKGVCAHGYGPNDSCPGCDHDDEVIRNAPDAYRIYITERVADKLGALIDLGILVWHTEDNSCSALLRTGTIVARHVSHDSAKRALELDHKVRSLPGAYNENVIRDLVRQGEIDEQAEVANVRLQHQVGKLVRQLIAHGVTTAEQFILACERVERDDALTQAMEEDLVFPTVSVADLPPFLRDGRPERSSAHVSDRLAWSHVDHAAVLDSLEHTHPVVTDVNDGSAL